MNNQPIPADSVNRQDSPAALPKVDLDRQLERILRDSLTLSATGSAAEILRKLAAIERLDAVFTRKAKSWGVALTLAGVLLFASIIIRFFFEMSLAFYPMIAGLLMLLIAAWFWQRSAHLNVPDRRHQLPMKILQYLKTDIPPNAEVSIQVDFRHFKSPKFLKAKVGGFFSGIKQFSYEVPWLTISSQFYDGTKFRLRVTQCVKLKSKAKRKRTKLTETFRDKCSLSLGVKPSRYPHLNKFEAAAATAPNSRAISLPTIRVIGNRINLQGLTAPEKFFSVNSAPKDQIKYANVTPALHLFVVAYHGLGKCRTA